MYAHCQQEGADGQRKYHYPHIEFSAWVQLWAQGNATKQYCTYFAKNPQTCRLSTCKSTPDAGGGPDWQLAALKQARQVVDEAHVVGVTGAYTASLCLALLRGPTQLSWRALAKRGCHCDGSPLEGSPGAAAAGPSAHQATGRSLRSSHGTHTSVIGIDGATRDRIRSLTWMDELLYARALARLEKDLEVLGWECLLAR